MGKADRIVMEEKIRKGEEKMSKQKKKEMKEKIKKDKIGFFADFKKFVTKGNVLDLAVAVVIGAAFNAIVTGLVKYIITPAMSYFTSGVSIDEWEYVLREEGLDAAGEVELAKISIQYGLWLQAIIDFIIIAFCIFVAVRIIKKAERKLNAKEIAAKEAEDAKKKAEADAKAAAEKAQLEADRAARDEFYANVREQSALLREIKESMKK